MKTLWFEGVRGHQQYEEERRIQILSAEKAFKILTGILEKKIQTRESERNRTECYELPAYPYMQADASGYIRALREVQSIINLQE